MTSGRATIRAIIRSGVALFDDWLTGVRDDGTHLITGGPGTGKSTIALHFADAAIRRGERVAMLVGGRADDIRAHARYIGLNLRTPLEDGRLLLLRYRPDFAQRAAHAASIEEVVGDFERLVVSQRPARIVIDTFAPFVAHTAASQAMTALVGLLDRAAACSLLTFAEDVGSSYDRSLEPLLQSAAAVVRLVRDGESEVRRAELVNIRYRAPASLTRRFVIREEAGLVAEQPPRVERLALRMP
jgi:circadian clock protein KaiC